MDFVRGVVETMSFTQADSPPLPRSFSANTTSSGHSFDTPRDSYDTSPIYTTLGSPSIICPISTVGHSRRVTSFGRRRRTNNNDQGEEMSSEASARTFAPQIPTFMSVYGEAEANRSDRATFTDNNEFCSQTVSVKRPATTGGIDHAANSGSSFAPFHQHTDSTSTSNTSNSDSADTSPTTSISTVDSSSMSDPSPGVLPESPASTVSPASAIMDNPRFRSLDTRGAEGRQGPFFELQRPATPQKKARNLKNLAVATSGLLPLSSTRAFPSAAPVPSQPLNAPTERTSAPASPSFVKPPTPPQRRRPSTLGLTIKTVGNGNLPAKLAIPSTPSLTRPNTLRHFQSSPSLPLFTPSHGPKDGMKLPPLRPIIPASNGFAEVPLEEEEQEPNFDVPQSREDKPEAYPNGPITIYESGVDLFYEPNVEIATQYDVILNVASEVENPFEVAARGASLLGSDSSAQILQDKAQMSHAVGIISNDLQQAESPDTPKATPIELPNTLISANLPEPAPSRPEYIHIPWEHNTDIVPDLYKLVTVIDDRVQQKKRVLVHCQCGVSRSASLIVAYGLYKNPGMSVQEAYDAVKKRSKWIGPNMSLIMQLQEFHSGLEQAKRDPTFRQKIFGANTPKGLLPRISPATPVTIRGAFESRLTPGPRPFRSVSARTDDVSPQRASTGDILPQSAGPVPRAPGSGGLSTFRRSWGASETSFGLVDNAAPPVPSLSPFVDTAGHLVPVDTYTSGISGTGSSDAVSQPRPKVRNFSRPTPERTVSADFFATLRPSPPAPVSVEDLRSPLVAKFGELTLPRQRDELLSTFTPLASSSPPLGLPERSEKSSFTMRSLTPPADSIMSPITSDFPDFPMPANSSLPKRESSPPIDSILSPTTASFPDLPILDRSRMSDAPESPEIAKFGMQSLHRSEESSDAPIFSPISTSFPRVSTPPRLDTQRSSVQTPDIDEALQTPRSAEFHMTSFPIIPSSDDDFGILSPMATSFPANPFASSSPWIPHPEEPRTSARSTPGSAGSRVRSKTPTPTRPKPWGEIEGTPVSIKLPSPGAETFRLTPSPPARRLRAKFSSPSIREQLKLQELQTEIAKTLPRPHEDADALLSPRAVEFINNPFHSERTNTVVEPLGEKATTVTTEHAGQNPVSNEESGRVNVTESDPRSPAQVGISPIVRNIWDVLE